MKIRNDFVTNSSSSSFILGFKSKKDIKAIADELPDYWSEDAKKSIVSDIEKGITTKEQAIELYQGSLWTTDWKFHGRDYWHLSEKERESEEYKRFIQDKKDELLKDLESKLNKSDIISIVEYGDHTEFGSLMEYEIMPCINNTIQHVSHH